MSWTGSDGSADWSVEGSTCRVLKTPVVSIADCKARIRTTQ